MKKPVFGREGNTVEIYGSNGTKIMEDIGKDYTNYPSLYQEYVELPVREFQSLKGRQQGHYIIGSFLLNGGQELSEFVLGIQLPITCPTFCRWGWGTLTRHLIR